ncbi:MAG TPA: cytochrome b/b6 domain-containing protein [Acidimicrobiales bacterium]
MAASATERDAAIVRNNRWTRLVHTACYLITAVLLATGWWIWSGHEGQPSLLARITNEPDVELHRTAGWALVALAGAVLTIGVRGAFGFVRETLRVDRGDWRWFLHWPRAALTGRFARHERHFDPGQRIANIAFVVAFGFVIVSGVGLTTLHGGPTFAQLVRIHRYATYALTALTAGHVLLAIGILPGYRGVWRAMHLGGRVPIATIRRLWPASAKVDVDASEDEEGSDTVTAGA